MYALLAALLLTPCASHPAMAAVPVRADWELLGSRRVSFAAEKDVIPAAHQGRFRAIKLVVKDADLEMFDVRVIFGNGERFSPATRFYFGGDTRSRVIDLPGDERVIRRIEFAYKSVRGGGDGRATIEVFGR